jgi:hypothetical protein
MQWLNLTEDEGALTEFSDDEGDVELSINWQ